MALKELIAQSGRQNIIKCDGKQANMSWHKKTHDYVTSNW